MYPIAPLSTPHNFVAAMTCRLFGKADTTKFSIEWVPLIDVVVNATIMNWNNILSDNLAMSIREYKHNISPLVLSLLFTSVHVLWMLYVFCSHFLNMGWKWNL